MSETPHGDVFSPVSKKSEEERPSTVVLALVWATIGAIGLILVAATIILVQGLVQALADFALLFAAAALLWVALLTMRVRRLEKRAAGQR